MRSDVAAAGALAGDGAVRRGAGGPGGAVPQPHRAAPAAPRAPARVHLRAAIGPRPQPALRPGGRRRRARRRQPRRRHHLPRPRTARRLPDPHGRQQARRRRSRPQRRAGRHRHARRLRRQRRTAARVPGCLGRRRRSEPAQDLRHRCAPQGRADDARLRPQRRHRHDLPPPAHRRVRHRRTSGDVAARGGRRRRPARGRRRPRPHRRTAVGKRADGTPGRRVASPSPGSGRCPDDSTLAVLARRRAGRRRAARRSRGARPYAVAAGGGGRRRRSVDHDAQARLVAPEGPPLGRGARPPPNDPLARPRHRVRGRRLPQPVGVLGRRHGDVHGARRPLHPRLRLLPRRHAQAAAAGRRRARPSRRGDRPDGRRSRRADDGRP